MDKLIDRIEQMEATISVLNEEKMDSKAKLRRMESRLLENEKKIQELGKERGKPSGPTKCGACVKKEEFKKMKRRLSDVERQQQRLQDQSQDANGKVERLDKLQLLLNSMMLRKQQSDHGDIVEGIKSDVDSLHDKCNDLNAKMELVSSTMDQLKKKHDLINKEVEESRRKLSLIDGLALRCTSAQNDVKDLQGTAYRTSQKIDTLTSNCSSIQKEVKDVKAKTELASSQMDELSKKWTVINKEFESRIPRTFQLLMKRVSRRNVAINHEEYGDLSALELIAGRSDGPAFNFEVNLLAGDSDGAEKQRQELVSRFYEKGITAPFDAMLEYVQICEDTCTLYDPNVQCHLVYGDEDYDHSPEVYILVIEPTHLRLLRMDSKEEEYSRPWTEIRRCQTDEYGWMKLTFQNRNTRSYSCFENNTQDVCKTISSLIMKVDEKRPRV